MQFEFKKKKKIIESFVNQGDFSRITFRIGSKALTCNKYVHWQL